MKLETWAQAVDEEMATNGFTRLILLEGEGVTVVFRKRAIIGKAVGLQSDVSTILVRAAIQAFEKEEGEKIFGNG